MQFHYSRFEMAGISCFSRNQPVFTHFMQEKRYASFKFSFAAVFSEPHSLVQGFFALQAEPACSQAPGTCAAFLAASREQPHSSSRRYPVSSTAITWLLKMLAAAWYFGLHAPGMRQTVLPSRVNISVSVRTACSSPSIEKNA